MVFLRVLRVMKDTVDAFPRTIQGLVMSTIIQSCTCVPVTLLKLPCNFIHTMETDIVQMKGDLSVERTEAIQTLLACVRACLVMK